MPDSPSSSNPGQSWQPPTSEELQALLPQYEIIALLGRGGMGAVYKGRQIAMDRPVAIKILSNLLDEADASFAERFKKEARAMGRLMHPCIVAAFDFGETADGLLYIVMEFVEGTDVSRMLAQQKRLSTAHAVAITAHVLDALAYAHERGIIHRDIKPANIVVGYDGVVKVADFGLAKMTTAESQSGLTQSGTAMGTLHYMAPEALMVGTSVDHRADIYAVGVMLYQMLTGKVPHGLFELPSLQVPGLDPRYDLIISKAIREDRELRYQSALEMRQALDAILTQPVAVAEVKDIHPPVAPKIAPNSHSGSKRQPVSQRGVLPNQQAYRPPPPAVSTPFGKHATSQAMAWMSLLVLAVFGGVFWLVFKQPSGSQPLEPIALKELPASANKKEVVASPSAGQSAPFVNSLGMKFVRLPGTEVFFGIHEVRYMDYDIYAAQVSDVDTTWTDQSADGFIPRDRPDDHPVTKVSWEDAKRFCAWLSKKEGRSYRLPTDQEWSIAVGIERLEDWKADTTPATVDKPQDHFPWGGAWPPPNGSGNYSDQSRQARVPNATAQYLESYNDGFPTTAPVMSFKPNRLGLFDLGGNVWEWCEDWYDNEHQSRVLRGGAWNISAPEFMLSSSRGQSPPSFRNGISGFRVVLTRPKE
jgi:serine/threonine protein kinase